MYTEHVDIVIYVTYTSILFQYIITVTFIYYIYMYTVLIRPDLWYMYNNTINRRSNSKRETREGIMLNFYTEFWSAMWAWYLSKKLLVIIFWLGGLGYIHRNEKVFYCKVVRKCSNLRVIRREKIIHYFIGYNY